MKFDIIIIGGGAAGLMAAAGASSGKILPSIAILEKMPRPARKVMITGKGRCNFTNMKEWNEFRPHVHGKADFLKNSFYSMPPARLMEMFEGLGLECVVERGDRAFPSSHKASDVVDTLVKAARARGNVSLYNDVTVNSIVCNESSEGPIFMLSTNGTRTFSCSRLIIATGGLSYPSTGSTGDGYAWAAKFGHKIVSQFPSLTALVPNGYKLSNEGPGDLPFHIDRSAPLSEMGKALCGLQLKNVGLAMSIDGRISREDFGDIDFTDGGLEGPLGFRFSRDCVKVLISGSKVSLILDLKPEVPEDELTARIKTLWSGILGDPRSAGLGFRPRLKVLLGKLLPKQLIVPFVRCNPGIISRRGPRKEEMLDARGLVAALHGWRMDISGYVGYERCVVTAGGVECAELNPKTLESKLRPGLHFCGEILDLDCDTGGYNLQACFSTGWLAGQSAQKAIGGRSI